MAGRDEIRIRFVKPNDSSDEAEIENSSNFLLVPPPRTTENSSPTPQTPANTTATTPAAPPPQTLSPEPARSGQHRLRLAVSEFSMKLAQRIEEKCNNNGEDVEKPPAKVDRLKRIALDVSKNVKSWSLEQQKLARIQTVEAQLKAEADPRARSSSLSEAKQATVPTEETSSNSDNGDNNGAVSNEIVEEPIDRGVEALQIEEQPFEPHSMRIPSSNRLKSISFNENLSQICSARQIPPISAVSQTSFEENTLKTSPLPVLTEHSEGETGLNSSSVASTEPFNSSDSSNNTTSSVVLETANEVEKLLPENVQKLSISLFSAAQHHLESLSQNKFFPAVILTLGVVILRFIGVPDMLIGCIVGTFVTWFLFVFTLPPHPKTRQTAQASKHHGILAPQANSQGKQAYVALMHLAYSYNPSTFRLRCSYICVLSLQGGYVKIGILDRKSLKEVRTKFSIDLESPSAEQLDSLTFTETHSFDLSTCSVSICPTTLARKRYFNKKYPILIARHPYESSLDRPSEVVSQEFYLFTLSMREKETWYTLLSSASQGISLKPFDLIPVRRIIAEIPKETSQQKKEVVRLSKLRTSISTGNIGLEAEQADNRATENVTPKPPNQKQEDSFQWHYVTRRDQLRWFLSQATVLSPTSPIAWFNAFAWRVFFEMMSVEELKKRLQNKMQGKLSKIILPRIIEPLRLSEMSLGHNMPLFKTSEAPYVDDRGLWLTFMVEYNGGLTGTIETRVNLLKAKNVAHMDPNSTGSPVPGNGLPKTPDLRYLDILASESCESCSTSSESDDEWMDPAAAPAAASSTHSGHLIERVTSSRYFARLIAINSVGRAAERVSLIPLTLRVELARLGGRFKINFPPCPSDRIWIGFEDDENFVIDVTLQPKVGNVELSGRTLHPIVSYLERKIVAEFKKKLVLPSMDDFYFGFFKDSIFKTEQDPVSSSTPCESSPHDS